MEDERASYERRLCHLVDTSDALMTTLRTVRSLGLASWCVGAGIVRSLVWDALHGYKEASRVGATMATSFNLHNSRLDDPLLQKRRG